MQFVTTINIKPVTWKRTGRGKQLQRFTPPVLRNYYYSLYAFLRDAGLTPLLPAPAEYIISLAFHFRDMRWYDTDNLLKAVLDCGQPSKWANKKDKPYMQDFWDDKVFAEVHSVRVRGSDLEGIYISIQSMA